jgi:hypothetical protein
VDWGAEVVALGDGEGELQLARKTLEERTITKKITNDNFRKPDRSIFCLQKYIYS